MQLRVPVPYDRARRVRADAKVSVELAYIPPCFHVVPTGFT